MNIRITCLVCLMLGQMLLAQEGLPPVGQNWEAKYTNGIAAVVNDRIITVDQLRDELQPLVPKIRRDSLTEEEFNEKLEGLSFEVLRNLINRNLIVKDFEKDGFQIPQVYIENEYNDHITEQHQGDRAEFHRWLKSEGKTPHQFREELKENMIVSFMRNRMRKSQSSVSPAKIREYYEKNKLLFYEKEKVKLRQIMLAPIASESSDLLMKEARKIVKEYKEGVPFDKLAKEHSQDDKAHVGGDWGWIERGNLSKALEEVAFTLEEGRISDPVEKEGYVFILFVEERRNEGVQPLHKVQAQIEETLASELARQAQQVWLGRLREEAFIRYYL